MCDTVFSTIKRTLGDAVRARSWYGEFRELVLMTTFSTLCCFSTFLI
jgi:IS5 family transposase